MLLLLIFQPMPDWNTPYSAFSPLNRHTVRQSALFRYEAGVAPSTRVVQRIADCGEIIPQIHAVKTAMFAPLPAVKTDWLTLAHGKSCFVCVDVVFAQI